MHLLSMVGLRLRDYLDPQPTRHALYLIVGSLFVFFSTLRSAQAQNGAALNFDGVDDYVSVSNTFPRLTTFTIEAWINPGTGYGTYTDSGEPVEIISRWGGGGPNNASFRFGISPAGKLTGAVFADGLGSTVVTSSATIQTNTWTHIAFTRSADNTLRLYINGVLDGSTANSVTPQSSTYTLNFGRPIVGNNRYKGSLDEVRIWNRELIACELTNRRNCEVSGTLANLVAAYNFNQGTAGSNNSGVNSLTDASGNNYNGTLNSFALNNATSNWVTPGGVTSGNTCPAFTLTANPSLTIANGNSTTLTASGANSYVWSTNATAANIIASPTTTTTYSVTGTTANGCVLASTTVTVPSALTVAIAASSTNVCAGNTISLTGTVTGGTTPYSSYSWVAPAGITINGSGSAITAATSTTLSGPQAVTLKVSDALNAPVTSRTLVINITSSQMVTIAGNLNITSGANTTLTASGANSYTWNTGESTTAITVSSLTVTTTYSVTGSTNGCVGSATATVTIVQSRDCNTFTTRTIADGLGSNAVNKVLAIGKTVYAATDGGLGVSTDEGNTFTNRTTGLSRVIINDIAVDGNTIYAATDDGLNISTDGGQSFSRVLRPGVATNLMKAVFVDNNTLYVSASSYNLYISKNGGQSFSSYTFEDKNIKKSYAVRDVWASGNTVYVAASEAFFISTDGGQTFTSKTIPNASYFNSVNAIGNTVYVGTTNGLAISTDAGANFTLRATSNGLGSNAVRDVFVQTGLPGGTRIYAGTDTGLSTSTDGGQTFTTTGIGFGIGSPAIRAVYAIGNSVYVATSAGLSIPAFNVQTLQASGTKSVGSSIEVTPGTSLTLRAADTNTGYLWNQGNATTKDLVVTTSGTYSVTATGSCPGTGSVVVTYLQATPATVSQVTPSKLGIGAKAQVVITLPALGNKAAIPAPPTSLVAKVTGPGYSQNIKLLPPPTQNKAPVGPPSTTTTVKLTSITQPGSYTLVTTDAKTKKIISYQVFDL